MEILTPEYLLLSQCVPVLTLADWYFRYGPTSFRCVTIHDFQDRFGAALLHPASVKEMAPKSSQLV